MRADVSTYATLAPFAQTFRGGVAALLYHKIAGWRTGVRRRGLYLSPRSFRAQLGELHRAEFRSVSAAESCALPQPRQSIVVTFDDGFASVLQNAAPVLNEFGWKAMNFLVSDRLGEVNTWEVAEGERAEPLMDEAQVRDWLARGHEIGAHTATHAHLAQIPIAAAREEIFASKKALEDRFSRLITDFAYPFGEFNEAVRGLVVEAGFSRAWSVESSVIVDASDRFALPRFPAVVSLRQPLNLLRSLIPRRR